jgi:membrane-associated phospholipid phosphatase
VLFAIAVAFSRVYLGVHYLPDVVAGFLAAATAAIGVYAVSAIPAVRARCASKTVRQR